MSIKKTDQGKNPLLIAFPILSLKSRFISEYTLRIQRLYA